MRAFLQYLQKPRESVRFVRFYYLRRNALARKHAGHKHHLPFMTAYGLRIRSQSISLKGQYIIFVQEAS